MAETAAQVPPPRAHQARYHGVFAPYAAWRPYVVPVADGAAAAIRRPSESSYTTLGGAGSRLLDRASG